MQECNDIPGRFEKSITRCKIINFASEIFEQKNKSKKANQIVQAKGTRDLFARLLFLSMKTNIKVSNVLSFPLLPLPPCFAHPDGSIRTTRKSAVLDILKFESVAPSVTDSCC